MGLRFRKSFKIAPGVKMNLNKKSASVSVGARGAHYTVNANGKKTASIGIPGTGISYTSSNDGGNSSKSEHSNSPDNSEPYSYGNNNILPNNDNQPKKKWYQKTGKSNHHVAYPYNRNIRVRWKGFCET